MNEGAGHILCPPALLPIDIFQIIVDARVQTLYTIFAMVGRKKVQKKVRKKTTTKTVKKPVKKARAVTHIEVSVAPNRVGHQKVAVVISLIGLALGSIGLFGLASLSLFFDNEDSSLTTTPATHTAFQLTAYPTILQVKEGFPALLDGVPATTGAVFDMNGDGSLEIVQGTTTGCVYVFSSDGSLFGSVGQNAIPTGDCIKTHNEDPWPLQLADKTTIVGSQPKPAQLDDDADLEFVIGTWKNYEDTTSDAKLYALDSSGVEIWETSISCGTYCTSPTVIDINGDGKDELFFSTNSDSSSVVQVTGINSDGSTLPGWPKQVDGPYAVVSVEDMNGSGSYAVFVSTGNQIYAFDVLGKASSGWPQKGGAIALGNIQGDEQKEIVTILKGDSVEDGSRFIYDLIVYDANGNRIATPSWNRETLIASDNANFIPILANLDVVGPYEIVVANSAADQIDAFYGDGSLVYGWPQRATTSELPTVGDLNGDGRVEIIASAYIEGIVRYTAFTRDGSIVSGFPFEVTSTVFQPLNADIDGDGIIEMIIAGLSKKTNGSFSFSLTAVEVLWDSVKLVDAQDAAGWRMWGRDTSNSFRYSE